MPSLRVGASRHADSLGWHGTGPAVGLRGLEAASACHSRLAAAFPLCGVLAYMTFAVYLFAATIKVRSATDRPAASVLRD
jgi:hypothetical protein